MSSPRPFIYRKSRIFYLITIKTERPLYASLPIVFKKYYFAETYVPSLITTALGALLTSPDASHFMPAPVSPSTVISVIAFFKASLTSATEASGLRPAFSIAALRTYTPSYASAANWLGTSL